MKTNCPRCGKSLPKPVNNCTHCGKKIDSGRKERVNPSRVEGCLPVLVLSLIVPGLLVLAASAFA